jgi:hypothetical protein
MADNRRIGFIGVGLMGHGMAKNAVEKGFPVTVVAHRRRDAVEDLIGRGAAEAASVAELAARAEAVVMCVTGAPEVERLVGEIVAAKGPVRAILDATTSDPDLSRRLHDELKPQGITFVDTPLSRTPAQAWTGELTTFVGGPPEYLDEWRPLIETWASAIIPVGGPVGTAHAVKLVNNLVGVGYAALWSECYATLARLGVEPSVFREMVTNSGMNCANFQNYSKYVCDGDAEGHKFTLANCLKDMSYYTHMADAKGAVTPMSDAALQILKIGDAMGMRERYVTEMVDIVKALNGRGRDG